MGLPIFSDKPVIESCEKLSETDSNCKRCHLSEGAPNPCMNPEGQPGGLMIVLGSPTQDDIRVNRIAASRKGAYVRALVSKHCKDIPVAYDQAIKCFVPRTEKKWQEAAEACRPYLAGVYSEIKPTRIITMGGRASMGLVGHSFHFGSARRSYTYINDIPVFFLADPLDACKGNTHIRRDYEADFVWALTAEPKRVEAGVCHMVAPGQDIDLPITEYYTYDCETSGKMFTNDFKLLNVSITPGTTGEAWIWSGEAIYNDQLREMLETLPLIGQNVKYDLHCVDQALGVEDVNLVGDTRVQQRLLHSEAASDLATMANMVGMGGHKDEAQSAAAAAAKSTKTIHEDLFRTKEEKKNLLPVIEEKYAKALKSKAKTAPALRDKLASRINALSRDVDEEDERIQREIVRDITPGRPNGKNYLRWAYGCVDTEIVDRYAARDTVATSFVHQKQLDELADEPDLAWIHKLHVIPSISAYKKMEKNGIMIDIGKVRNVGKRIGVEMQEVANKLRNYERFDGLTFDEISKVMNSPAQKMAFLYDDLKLDPPKGKRSSDKKALNALEGAHPVIEHVQEWAGLAKLKSTYTEALVWQVGSDGRIHTTYNVDGTRSGRTSTSGPNLQNIPKNGELAKLCKSVFVAKKGCVFVQCDYSQLEPRVAAMLSGDEALAKIFWDGVDPYQGVADFCGITRSEAKVVFLALMYGLGDNSLAASLSISKKDATALRLRVLGSFKGLANWIKETKKTIGKCGEVWTYWDGRKARRRQVYRNDGDESHQERAGVNSPIQGSANEYKLASVIELIKVLPQELPSATLVNETHDSILVEVPEAEWKQAALIMKRVMEQWPACGVLDVPLKVSCEMGKNWGNIEEIEWEDVT